MRRPAQVPVAVAALLAATACEDAVAGGRESADAPPVDPPSAQVALDIPRFPRELLLEPTSCRPCHPLHYDEWARSMHAYSAVDPVFIAMNRRGQRETGGELGKFCVQCHAPMALREGLTTDGLNLSALPKWSQGVTCYFCHNTAAYGEQHFNANLALANDLTMRGSYADAVDPGVHGVAYSELHDRDSMKSSIACGTCHDIVNDHGIHIERTLKEYEASAFSLDRPGNFGGASCQGCHMAARADDDYIANMPAAPLVKRALHRHDMPAVDIALTDDFPGQAEHRRATECALSDAARVFRILQSRPGEFEVHIETDAGHHMPSGAAQDRRLWLEFVAYDAADRVIYQSGKIGDQEIEEHPPGSDKYDPALCMMRDHLIDAQGNDTHMFWEAAQKSRSRLLPPLMAQGQSHVLSCDRYRIPGRRTPARIEVRLKMRPMGMDTLRSLVDSGDLDPKILARVPTFTLHRTAVEWRSDSETLRPLEPEWSRRNCPRD